jgi:hypothetical protein
VKRGAASRVHRPARIARTLTVAAALVLCAAAAPGAHAQARGGEPTAEHLWEAYPLDDGTPPPVPTRTATPEPEPDRRAAPNDPGDGDAWPLPVLLATGALVAGGLAVQRRRAGARPSPPDPAPAPARRRLPRAPALPLLSREARMTPTGRFRRTTALPRPPEPLRPWIADVRWEQEAGSGRFRAVAASADGDEAELLCSEPIPWPPSTDGARALAEAVEAIEATLLEAGWQARPKGEAWYARRYAWAPERAVAVASRPALTPPTPTPAPAPPAAADPWTDAALQLAEGTVVADLDRWRCRIRWRAGWRSSRFEAIVMPPGKKRGPCIAASAEFAWTFKADPDPGLPEVRAAVAALRAELRAAGWEPAGIGRQWYAHRFAWTSDDDPPDTVTAGPVG